MFDIMNNGIIVDPKEMLGIIDLRSLGHYKIKQGTLQQHLSKHYRFKKADTLCKQFNKCINMLKRDSKKNPKKNTHG